VVALYSTFDIPSDEVMLNKFVEDFKAWIPEPKWKLVIDLGNLPSKTNKQVTESAVPKTMMHCSHLPKQGGDSKPRAVVSMTTLGSTGTLSFQSTTVTLPNTSTTTMTTMVHHRHAPTKPKARASSFSSRTSSIDSTFDDATEQDIASLLGDHMPSNDGSAAAALLPHFMSLRLMLLRVSERRSPEENDKLVVLKCSYADYS